MTNFKHNLLIFWFALILLILVNKNIYSNEINADSLAVISLVLDKNSKEVGEPLIIAVNFKLKKDWHIYWRNPGDSGLETTFDWDFKSTEDNEDYKLINMISDIPHKHTTDNITDYIYDGEFNYFFEFAAKIDLKQNLKNKTNKYTLKISYLICNEICIPVTKEIEFAIGFNQDNYNNKLNNNSILNFNDFRPDYKRLKNEYIKLTKPASYNIKNNKLILVIEKKELNKYQNNITNFETFNDNILFFPYQNGLINNTSVQTVKSSNDSISIEVDKDDYVTEYPNTFSGILINKNLWTNNSKAIEIEFQKK